MNFPCTSCGCCCKRVDAIVKNLSQNNPKDDLYFPYKWDESGKCENLEKDNTCRVYDNRPLVCDINSVGRKSNLNLKDFYNLNIVACNKIMDEDNIDKSLRIHLIL